jgi:hypothetical protein
VRLLLAHTGFGPCQVSEGAASAQDAHGPGGGPVQVCIHGHHQVYQQGKTHLKHSIIVMTLFYGQGKAVVCSLLYIALILLTIFILIM